MKYQKPALTFDEQVEQLLSRGMSGDRDKMRRRLASVSYYRLSGYWFHRKLLDDDTFQPGTTFDVAWEQYIFDRKLRLLLMDAIERIEVGVRTQFSYHHAHSHGPFGYFANAASLPGLAAEDRTKALRRISEEVLRSKERFVTHFGKKYGDHHPCPPIWMATEVMSFGCVLGLLKGSSNEVRDQVARTFGVSDKVLLSWLWALSEVRNVCAHHGRLWNRELGNKPMIPYAKHHPEWHAPVAIPNQRVFSVLTICAYSLKKLAPHSSWQARLWKLVVQSPHIPVKNMGFPVNWLECPLWSGAADASR
jgi:abortive infection bacteriophage resistance protein